MKTVYGVITRTFVVMGLAAFWCCDQAAQADFACGVPTKIPNVSRGGAEGMQISPDGLELYFSSPGDIYVARRSAVTEPWSTPVRLDPPVNSTGPEHSPCISADGLELYFSEGWPMLAGSGNRPGAYGRGDLWVSRRATKADPWGTPENLGPSVNTGNWEDFPSLSADGLTLYFTSGVGSDLEILATGIYPQIYVSTRPTKQDPWGPRVPIGSPINTSIEQSAFIAPDGLLLFFSRGLSDIYVSRRAGVSEPWGNPVRLMGPINDRYAIRLSFSAEDPTFYLVRGDTYTTGFDLWQAPVRPIVDFNGDGLVDIEDLAYFIPHWGTPDTTGDIWPMPWGDGKVDQKDLEVLMGYWDQKVEDPTLVASWPLDESTGSVAQDGLLVNNGTVYGNPVWRPDGGKVDGALEFDGVNDYVQTPPVIRPFRDPFSVLAWIKGGKPGQVIFSQKLKLNWLSTDANTGCLMTELKGAANLRSQRVVTDGDWHRIGLAWDGSYRILYVDGEEVARDQNMQSSLISTSFDLYIGAGNRLTTGTFWSGLIDDVRIYNRAVLP